MKDGELGVDARLYRFRRHFDERHGDGASMVKVERVSGEFAVDSPIASCAGGLLGHARQGAVGETCDSTERAGNESKHSVLLNGPSVVVVARGCSNVANASVVVERRIRGRAKLLVTEDELEEILLCGAEGNSVASSGGGGATA